MTAKDIISLPDPRLREKSKRIGHINPEIEILAANMIQASLEWEDTRAHEFCAALAAVQVGALERVVVVRNDFEDKTNRSFGVYINPEIVKYDGTPIEELEGCLSVKDVYGSVKRYPKVKVKALNLKGEPIRLTATDFLARVFQHEIDHTNGIIFVDHVTEPSKLFKLEDDGSFTQLDPTNGKSR